MDERSWWWWALHQLTARARAEVRLLIGKRQRANRVSWPITFGGWIKLGWTALRADPYQRRLIAYLIGAVVANWLIVPLGYQAAVIIHGVLGIALGLPLVLSPAILLMHGIVCAYESWVYQSSKPLIIGAE